MLWELYGLPKSIVPEGVLLDLKHVLTTLHLVQEILSIQLEASQAAVLVRVDQVDGLYGFIN